MLKKAGKKGSNGVATQAVTRIVGALHNAVQIPIALSVLASPVFIANPVYAITNLSTIMLTLSGGYFLHDLVFCIIRFELEGPFYTMHALFCCIAYTYGLQSGFLHYYGAAFLMWEASTPFVHIRWFMFKLGAENTTAYVLNGVAMIVAFFSARIVWGYLSTYRLILNMQFELANPRPGSFPVTAVYIYMVAAMSLNSLNTYWFSKMVQKVGQVVFGGKKGSEVSHEKDE
ncbi:MAG: hypothetical protein WDW36_002596 [Sanguina aurantia]